MTGPNLSTAQTDVINALRTHGPCTVRTIADITGRNKSSVTIAVRALSSSGFIEVIGTDGTSYKRNLWGVVQ